MAFIPKIWRNEPDETTPVSGPGLTNLEIRVTDYTDSRVVNTLDKTILDAKGDIISASAPDTPVRVAIGPNGTVPTADTTAAAGWSWQVGAASAPTTTDIKTRRMIHMGSDWDAHIVAANRANFEEDISLMVGFRGTPQWTVMKTWNLEFGIYAYLNIWSDTGVSYAVYQNDSDAAALYNPFASNERRAMDLKSSTYKTGFINACKAAIADGAKGMFFDDTNLDYLRNFRRADGSNPLTNFDAGAFYTSTITGLVGWPALLADFLTEVRDAVRVTYPNAKFIFNPVWTDLASTGRWTDPRWARFCDACDWMIIEHGATDTGLTAGVGQVSTDFALRSQNLYVDAIHARGKAVLFYANDTAGTDTPDGRRYEMAHYLDKQDRSRPDMIGIWQEGTDWPIYDPVFNIDLGSRKTRVEPNTANTTIQSRFARGNVAYMPAGGLTTAKILENFKITPLDDFERADSSGSLGASWGTNIHSGFPSWSIVSGKASTVITNFRSNYWLTSFAADQRVGVQLATIALPRLVCRLQNPGATPTYYDLSYTSATPALFVSKTVAGTRTQVGSTIQVGLAVGDWVELEVKGDVLNVYINGLLISTRTDGTPITGAGFVGFSAHSATDFQFSAFSGGAV